MALHVYNGALSSLLVAAGIAVLAASVSTTATTASTASTSASVNSYKVAIDVTSVLATTGPRFAPAFGLEMWAMMGMMQQGDFTDPALIKAASGLRGASIRVGGITADFLRYIADNTTTPPSSSSSSSSSPSSSSPRLTQILETNPSLKGFWPSYEENMTMTQFKTLAGFFSASGFDLLFDLNELHGRNCNTTGGPYNQSDWCTGQWDTSNVEWFLQQVKAEGLVGTTSLFGFELGNELVTHLYPSENTQDILTLSSIIKNVWNDTSSPPPLYAPSTDTCEESSGTFNIMNDTIGAIAGFTYHAYPGQSGAGIDNLTQILLNTTWLSNGILTGSDSIACINGWSTGPARASGMDLWITESSSSWQWNLPPPAQNSFIHGFFTIAELGQYASLGVGMVARWSFSENSPFGTLLKNNSASPPQWDASHDYFILTAYAATVGHEVLQTTVTSTPGDETAIMAYAHCAKSNGGGGGSGALTILAINPSSQAQQFIPVAAAANGNAIPLAPRLEYVFTAPENNLSSTTPIFNGNTTSPLRLAPDGTPPVMNGNLVETDGNTAITMPPYSQAFYVMLSAGASACP